MGHVDRRIFWCFSPKSYCLSFARNFIRPLQVSALCRKAFFIGSLTFRKVIFHNSIVEVDTLYKMAFIWDQLSRAIENDIFVICT